MQYLKAEWSVIYNTMIKTYHGAPSKYILSLPLTNDVEEDILDQSIFSLLIHKFSDFYPKSS
jgi:hypothetical protein